MFLVYMGKLVSKYFIFNNSSFIVLVVYEYIVQEAVRIIISISQHKLGSPKWNFFVFPYFEVNGKKVYNKPAKQKGCHRNINYKKEIG